MFCTKLILLPICISSKMCYLLKYTLQFLVIALVVSFISKKDIVSTEVLTVAAISTVCIAFIDKLYYPVDSFEAFDPTQIKSLKQSFMISQFQGLINKYDKINKVPITKGKTYTQILQEYLDFLNSNNVTAETVVSKYYDIIKKPLEARVKYLNDRLTNLYKNLDNITRFSSKCEINCDNEECLSNCKNVTFPTIDGSVRSYNMIQSEINIIRGELDVLKEFQLSVTFLVVNL